MAKRDRDRARHETRTFRPIDLLELNHDPRDFGSKGRLQLQLSPELPGNIDPLQAVAATLWQHLLVRNLRRALGDSRWSVDQLARHTPGIGADSWHNVMEGRTLIRADHVGAALVVLNDATILPTRQQIADAIAQHESRLIQGEMFDDALGWHQVGDLGVAWLEVRSELRRPRTTGRSAARRTTAAAHG